MSLAIGSSSNPQPSPAPERPYGVVYTWGKGEDCLGLPAKKLDNSKICPFPTRVPLLNHVVQVDCGESCTAAVTFEGHLYIWGSGHGGRLGFGNENDVSQPTQLLGPLRDKVVVQVSVGENHVACLTSDGHVYAWGNGYKGALGDGNLSSHKQMVPKIVNKSDGIPLDHIVKIDCSYQNSAAITDEGELFVWGSSDNYKLGLGSNESVSTPKKIENLPPVKAISLGSAYSGAVTTDGQLYMWGFGKAGNLGVGTRETLRIPTLVDKLAGERIASISCTRNQIHLKNDADVEGKENPHSFAVTEDGKIFSFGTSHKGILGNLKNKALRPIGCDELVPYHIGGQSRDKTNHEDTEYFKGTQVVQAVASSIHSAVLADGKVFSFGCGSDGRMGVHQYMDGLHGGRDRLKCYVSVPTTVENLKDKEVLQIASSRRHMCALVKEEK